MNKKIKGLTFPLSQNTNSKKDNRSTIDFQLNLIHSLSPSYSELNKTIFINKEKTQFRQNYPKIYFNLMCEALESPENATNQSLKGMEYLRKNLVFIKDDGSTINFEQEMMENKNNPFTTQTVKSEIVNPNETKKYAVKYKGQIISGETLCKQINQWRSKEVMENDAKNALISVALSHQKSTETIHKINLDKLDDHIFILIGAGSAMCPFDTLVELGSTIVAIDISIPQIWKRLEDKVKKHPNSKMYFPAIESNGVLRKGCDLLKQPAEILNWLKTLDIFDGKIVTIGNYTYLDGGRHVLLSSAADAIISGLGEKLGENLNVAFLCTPTDISPVPKESYYASYTHFNDFRPGKFIEMMIKTLSFGKQLQRNDIKRIGNQYIYNGLVVAQGPNYALAKLIQLWRSVLHYTDTSRGKVSLNVAPATATLSVIHNKTFKWAFSGMPYFLPMQIFQPETSNSIMTGLLLKDILTETESKTEKINPVAIKSRQAVHGGAWRCGYSQNTIGFSSVLVHFLGGPKNFVNVVFVLLLTVIALITKSIL